MIGHEMSYDSDNLLKRMAVRNRGLSLCQQVFGNLLPCRQFPNYDWLFEAHACLQHYDEDAFERCTAPCYGRPKAERTALLEWRNLGLQLEYFRSYQQVLDLSKHLQGRYKVAWPSFLVSLLHGVLLMAVSARSRQGAIRQSEASRFPLEPQIHHTAAAQSLQHRT